jgi:hypothetical protein
MPILLQAITDHCSELKDMFPAHTKKTLTVDRSTDLAELREFVRLVPTYERVWDTADGPSEQVPWRYGLAQMHFNVLLGRWEIRSVDVVTEDGRQSLLHAGGPGFFLETWRGQPKSYKTIEAVYADLLAIFGENSDIGLVLTGRELKWSRDKK